MRRQTILGVVFVAAGVAIAVVMGLLWALEIWGPSNWDREPEFLRTSDGSESVCPGC